MLATVGNRQAKAQTVRKSKRLLIFITSTGMWRSQWNPTNVVAENNFTFSNSTQPLAAIKDRIVLVDGLSFSSPQIGHYPVEMLTGTNPGHWSVDQYVSQALGLQPPLLLGARTVASDDGAYLFYKNGTPQYPQDSPAAAYNALFINNGASAMSSAQLTKVLTRRKSVIDLNIAQIAALQSRIGASEKLKLQAHLDSLRDLENQLAQTSTGICNPMAPPNLDFTQDANTAAVAAAHISLIVNAFQCNVASVAAIQWGYHQHCVLNVPGLNLSNPEIHNGIVHNTGTGPMLSVTYEQWCATQFVNLVQTLGSISEADGSGTLLDNTLLFWTRDISHGQNHTQYSMPYVLAGGAGGYLKTDPNGRYLNFGGDDYANVTGERHERILLNLCEAMGVSDFSGFGSLPQGSKAPLPKISTL